MRFERMTYPLKGRTPKRMQGVGEFTSRTLCCVLLCKTLILEGLYLLSKIIYLKHKKFASDAIRTHDLPPSPSSARS